MKNLKISLFTLMLLAQVCFAQKVFKVKEGQLQFVNPGKGVFIKKGNLYYQVRLQRITDYEQLSKCFTYELEIVTLAEIEYVKKDISTILASDIVKADFKILETQKITTKNDNNKNNYQFYKYNKNFFGIDFLKDSVQKPVKQFLFYYCILDFGNNKKIIWHDGGFIIPAKERIRFLFEDNDLNESFKNYQTSQLKSLTTSEVFSTAVEKLRLNENFYRIDTLKNKQVQIKDLYNENVIPKSFDSIAFNGFFIAGYQKGKINLYNYTFQDLKITNSKAVSLDRFFPVLQVIEGNSMRRINLIGKDYNGSDIYYNPGFSNYFDPQTAKFTVVKENDSFYLQSYSFSIHELVPNLRKYKEKYQLLNSNAFETVEFLDEEASITLQSEMSAVRVQYPLLLYTKLKNGKFNLTTIEYLITENPGEPIVAFNAGLPKNLDAVTVIGEQKYLIEKGGLFTYYPIMKAIKYKKLEPFQENFARFELPNGQKGWLDLKGNEYLDN